MEILDPLTDPRWPDLLARAPAATIFHHPAWMRLACGEYGYPLSAWAIAAPDGSLAAALPVALLRSRLTGSRLVALPFSERCPPLLVPGAGDAAALATALDAGRRRLGLTLEVRGEIPSGHGAEATKAFVGHQLALQPDAAAVEARFASQVRRSIAKAGREGVSIERRTDAEGLRRFYRLHLDTRRRQGVPTQPLRFVLRFQRLFALGLGFVLLARQHGRDVAAAVFLSDGRTLTFEFGASDHVRRGSRPNHLLFAEVIRWACETGHRTLDFGRTDLDNEGLARFKASWGAAAEPLRYHCFGAPALQAARGRARDVLAPAIRRAPPQFGRLVGSALYRHMG